MPSKRKMIRVTKKWSSRFFSDNPDIEYKLNLYLALMGDRRKCNPIKNKTKKKLFRDLNRIFGDIIE